MRRNYCVAALTDLLNHSSTIIILPVISINDAIPLAPPHCLSTRIQMKITPFFCNNLCNFDRLEKIPTHPRRID